MIDGNLLLSQRAMKQARDERTGGGTNKRSEIFGNDGKNPRRLKSSLEI
jgi:hypothetical protein